MVKITVAIIAGASNAIVGDRKEVEHYHVLRRCEGHLMLLSGLCASRIKSWSKPLHHSSLARLQFRSHS